MAGPPGNISGAPDSSAQSRSHLPSRDTEPLLTTVTHAPLHPRPPAHCLLPLCSLRVAKGEPADVPGFLPRFANSNPASASPPESLGQRPRDSGQLNPDSCYPKLCCKERSCLEEWSLGKEPSAPRALQLASQQMPTGPPGPPPPGWMAPPMVPRAGTSVQKDRLRTCRNSALVRRQDSPNSCHQ